MEIVVLNSDIARLVLDYLKSQKLNKAKNTFCKTSPYLKQEFSAYKQGLQTHSFFPKLEEIICEYVKISRKVEQLLPKLTDALRAQLQQCKLSEKVTKLLEHATPAATAIYLSNQKNDSKNSLSTLSSATAASAYNNNEQENSITNDKETKNQIKRKRSTGTSNNNSSNDDLASCPTNRKRLLYSTKKRRRLLEPYCFLSTKALQRHKRRHYIKTSIVGGLTSDELVEGEEEEDEECSSSSIEEDNETVSGEAAEDDDDGECGAADEEKNEIFAGEKPTKESTPRNKNDEKCDLIDPILPEISQAILDNPEFQQKLVENINQALNKSECNTVAVSGNQNSNQTTTADNDNCEVLTSVQILDQMVKNILEATEKDPSFDDIIHEVVEASNKPQVHSAAVQCNINSTNIGVLNPPLYTATEPPPLVPTQPLTQLQIQSLTRPPLESFPQTSSTMTSTASLLNIPSASAPPRTPMIIRSAIVAGGSGSINALPSATPVALGNSGTTTQDSNALLASNSFGSLIDPNFSISKFIVLNSNESGQKSQPENGIGNTTADNLLNQLSTSGVIDPNDDQVFFDSSASHVTFPLFFTNDGLLTNLPVLINNELVSQQLQPNNIANIDSSRIEMPLAEPLMVNANQLPPNSVILSSNQKANMRENTENPETVEKLTKDPQTKHCNTVPPPSSDNRFLYDKATPSTSGIVNTKGYKSLSTPRKRASHVRTLTFSPRAPQTLSTPLSTRREVISRFQRSLPKALQEEDKSKPQEKKAKAEEKENATSEKAVIKTVEILPTISNAVNGSNESLKENTNVSTNDNTNIPPLFINEESSNQTIINKSTSLAKETLKPKVSTNLVKAQTTTGTYQADDNTPKRRQLRKTTVRACKRQLSKSSNEGDMLEEKAEKENERKTSVDSLQQTNEKSTEDDLMEEWKRLRNSSNVDLDVRLRELNAKRTELQPAKKVNTKKRVRRKKPAAIKKKEKQLVKEAEKLERYKDLESVQANLVIEEQSAKAIETSCENTSHISAAQRVANEKSKEKPKEFNIKITTPQKLCATGEKINRKDKKPKEKQKNEEVNKQEEAAETAVLPLHLNEVLEREKRTTNMAFLLETPFKDPNLSSYFPPTPGIFAPSLETPSGKQNHPHDEMHASASFLFGSLTKSELNTPLASAVTPGFRFTPFGMKEIATPKSATATDYSSGAGSYYKPDESEDLDRNIDKMLKTSAQKKCDSEEQSGTEIVEDQGVEFVEEVEEGEIVAEQGDKEESAPQHTDEIEKIEVEIPVEKLKVEPIVLKRVKSFGSEAVDSVETAKINPHYTLASGLPEISAAEEESSSSSSSSSSSASATASSSSTNSSSSSSSSASSSSSSAATNVSAKSKIIEEQETCKKVRLNDLENLSEISSTEDEEWHKLPVTTDNDENSQLVNNDGEVRYPVRSWLTPIKENITNKTKITVKTENTQTIMATKQATIKVTLPLKSAEKRNRQVRELELKRERIKEKLKIDATTITKKEKPSTSVSVAPNISAAMAASRMMHAMRDKSKKPACFQTQNISIKTLVEEKRSIDVLTALQLSAKKHLSKTPENPAKTFAIQNDDNASVISPENLKEKSKIIVPLSPINKTPQRKCLPIEARPVTRTIRKSGKKIVRTPLAFKVIHSPGKINSHSTTTTLADFAATKTLNKTKESTSPLVQQTLRISPRLMKTTKFRGKKSPSESPVSKSKISTRNTKAKVAAAANAIKPKVVTRATKNNKSKKDTSQAPLEKEMKQVLHNWKEKSVENKSDNDFNEHVDEKPTTPIKPKINLKTRNTMISTKSKIKSYKNDEITAMTSKEDNSKETTTKTTLILGPQAEIEFPLKEKSAQKLFQPIGKPLETVDQPLPPSSSPQAEEIEESSEDDPTEDCEITTIDETDTKRFIKYYSNGPDDVPQTSSKPQQHDFSNFQMVVAIDENEKHVWRITEGICLFSCAPSIPTAPSATTQTAIRNIPKKRKIRATTILTEKPMFPSTSTTKIAAIKSFNTNTPAATSTPVGLQETVSRTTSINNGTSSSKRNGEKDDLEKGTKTNIAKSDESNELNEKPPPTIETNNDNPKIQIEDIETILSHLHGT